MTRVKILPIKPDLNRALAGVTKDMIEYKYSVLTESDTYEFIGLNGNHLFKITRYASMLRTKYRLYINGISYNQYTDDDLEAIWKKLSLIDNNNTQYQSNKRLMEIFGHEKE